MSLEDLREWGGRDLLAVVLALVVVAIVDWLAS